MSDGTRRVRMVWKDPGEELAAGFDVSALEFRMNPIPRAGDVVSLTVPNYLPVALRVLCVQHHVTPVTPGADTLHHVDLWVERITRDG